MLYSVEGKVVQQRTYLVQNGEGHHGQGSVDDVVHSNVGGVVQSLQRNEQNTRLIALHRQFAGTS